MKKKSVKKKKQKKVIKIKKPKIKNKKENIKGKKEVKKIKTKKQEKNKRFTFGLKNLDKNLGGGFLKDTTNLIIGGTGSGKTIFSLQFLIEGMEKKEICLYISFEEKREPFFRNAKLLGWDLEEYEKKGLFIFIEYTPGKVRTMLEEGGGIIESTILNKNVQRVVIDSITSFTLLFENETEKRELSLSLFDMLRKWDCTTILTYEAEPEQSDNIVSKTIEFEADSIIFLYFMRKQGERKRYLEIIKMRGTKHSKKIYPFIIEKKGIKISSKTISKI